MSVRNTIFSQLKLRSQQFSLFLFLSLSLLCGAFELHLSIKAITFTIYLQCRFIYVS